VHGDRGLFKPQFYLPGETDERLITKKNLND
jgi:hypothetical protein